MSNHPLIRSFLFVPAANEKLLASALGRSADAIILDLEDGTHPSMRGTARARIADSIASIKAQGKIAAVRINADWLSAVQDLNAVIEGGADIIVLPKVEHPRDVQILDRIVDELALRAQLPSPHARFLLQIESAKALPRVYEIAQACARIMGMMLGSEDYALDCGAIPTPDTLFFASMTVLNASRAAGIQPIGLIDSIASLGDLEAFTKGLVRAKALGFRGAVVVHPKFLDAINACYTPTAEQIGQAQEIVQKFEQAFQQGLGAIKVGDLMIDKPVYLRALACLNQARA
ncbi:CoA ester lyase [Bordetella sp. FB-8]|uniref:HpcH/HpaI aldolase/citrate lyase family protein n=1 Tax=Bordetella sp. FB-8 TaxID=1159870 RepID=UPI00036A9168|nr:CoA ester lyase [Bordetella sp. FB-8]